MAPRRFALVALVCILGIVLAAGFYLEHQAAQRTEDLRKMEQLQRENRLLRQRIHRLAAATLKGEASWYDNRDGFATATGETFDEDALTCAMRLPRLFGHKVRVTNLENGKSVVVRVNDYGPAPKLSDRVVDLSRAAFDRIAALGHGLIKVRVRILA